MIQLELAIDKTQAQMPSYEQEIYEARVFELQTNETLFSRLARLEAFFAPNYFPNTQ